MTTPRYTIVRNAETRVRGHDCRGCGKSVMPDSYGSWFHTDTLDALCLTSGKPKPRREPYEAWYVRDNKTGLMIVAASKDRVLMRARQLNARRGVA